MEFNAVTDVVTGTAGWKAAASALMVWSYTSSASTTRGKTNVVVRF
jgi:hypothetical protein